MKPRIPPSPLPDVSSVLGDAASRIAPHEIRFEAADVLVVEFHQILEQPAFRAFWEIIGEVGAKYGAPYVLLDLSDLEALSPETRAAFARVVSPFPIAATAMIGGSLSVRMSVRMMLRATKMLAPKLLPYDVELFNDEAAARAWIEKHRDKRRR